MAARRRPTSSCMRAATRANARLSPRPAPRPNAGGDGVVVVVAQEALATAAAEWQDRSEHEAAASARLRQRVDELEAALRKVRTEVKRRRELPNNEVFTKGLVDENHALVKRNRALLARLARYQGRGADAVPWDGITHNAERKPKSTSASPVDCATSVADVTVQTEPSSDPVEGPDDEHKSKAVLAAVRPLAEALKSKLKGLETDLSRLHQENELLRGELSQYALDRRPLKTFANEETQPSQPQERVDLHARVAAQSNLIKILEVRYQHLHEKAELQAKVYQESLMIQKELSTKLLESQQLVGEQRERLAQYSDEHAVVEDLRKEVHILRADNAALNGAVSTLSSRPFDNLTKELQKKNVVIAELEEEKKTLEKDAMRAKRDARAARSAKEQAQMRVKDLEAEIQTLMSRISGLQLYSERVQMESEVARFQLRFYTAPPDKELLVALGHAVRSMKKKKQEHKADDLAASCLQLQGERR